MATWKIVSSAFALALSLGLFTGACAAPLEEPANSESTEAGETPDLGEAEEALGCDPPAEAQQDHRGRDRERCMRRCEDRYRDCRRDDRDRRCRRRHDECRDECRRRHGR